MKLLDLWILRRFLFTYVVFSVSVLVVYVATDSLNRFEKFQDELKKGINASDTAALSSRAQDAVAAPSSAAPGLPANAGEGRASVASADVAGMGSQARPKQTHEFRELAKVMAGYYAAEVPEMYYLLAPFVTLIAGLWVVFELKRHNELVPLMAAGIPAWRIVAPIFVASTFLAVLMFLDRDYLLTALSDTRREHTKFAQRDALVPNPVPDSKGGVLSGQSYSPISRELRIPKYTRLDDQGRELFSATAMVASYVASPEGWVFKGGALVEPSRAAACGREPVPIPSTGRFIDTDVNPDDVESGIESVTYLTPRQMLRQMERVPSFRARLGVQYVKRWSYPCASVVLLFLGLPFVLRGDKGAAALGLLGCVGVSALFFMVTGFCEDAGSRGAVDFRLAVWLPDLIFGLPGILIFSRFAR